MRAGIRKQKKKGAARYWYLQVQAVQRFEPEMGYGIFLARPFGGAEHIWVEGYMPARPIPGLVARVYGSAIFEEDQWGEVGQVKKQILRDGVLSDEESDLRVECLTEPESCTGLVVHVLRARKGKTLCYLQESLQEWPRKVHLPMSVRKGDFVTAKGLGSQHQERQHFHAFVAKKGERVLTRCLVQEVLSQRDSFGFAVLRVETWDFLQSVCCRIRPVHDAPYMVGDVLELDGFCYVSWEGETVIQVQ